MKLIPKKTFLLRQDESSDGKKKDIIAHKGVALEVTDKEAAKFFGYFIWPDKEKKAIEEKARTKKDLTRLV